MPPPLTLDGPRLRLRHWREADRDAFAAINADPAVMRHFAAPLSRAESDAAFDRLVAHFAEHGWGFWAVERHETLGCIGAVGLLHLVWEAELEGCDPPRRLGPPMVEIGWRIATTCQRQGFAAEPARLALGAGFGRLGLAEIFAFTVPPNLPSWRLMEALGMRRLGHFAHPRLPAGHPLQRHLLYRIGREMAGFPSSAPG